MRWAGHVACVGEGRGVYRVLVGRPEGKRPLGRPRRRWEDNIEMDLREIRIDGAIWIQLAQDRVQWRAWVNTVMDLRVPYESGIFFDKLIDNQFFSNNILHHGVSKIVMMIYIERVKELSLSRRTTLWMPCSGSEGKAPHQHYLEMNGRSPVTCCQKVCWAPKRGWTF
jgi:hypothetical protein